MFIYFSVFVVFRSAILFLLHCSVVLRAASVDGHLSTY